MKVLITIITLISCTLLLCNFTFKNGTPAGFDISGKWKIEIDNAIDGDISGNHGCSVLKLIKEGANGFVGEYANCSGSQNAKDSQFSGEIFITQRGNLISMIQDNHNTTQYYANWSGKFFGKNEIRGIWTDVVGNQGEFKLSR